MRTMTWWQMYRMTSTVYALPPVVLTKGNCPKYSPCSSAIHYLISQNKNMAIRWDNRLLVRSGWMEGKHIISDFCLLLQLYIYRHMRLRWQESAGHILNSDSSLHRAPLTGQPKFGNKHPLVIYSTLNSGEPRHLVMVEGPNPFRIGLRGALWPRVKEQCVMSLLLLIILASNLYVVCLSTS